MSYIIYDDVVFLINFLVDFFLLAEYGRASKRPRKLWRILLGGLAGAAGSVLSSYGIRFLFPILAFFMPYIAYSRFCPDFYIMLLVTGGSLFLLKEHHMLGNHLTGFLLETVFIILAVGWVLEQARPLYTARKSYYPITLKMGSRVMEGTALLDTGNRLYDPISKKPVMLGEYQVLKEACEIQAAEGFRMIPFHSVGKEHGMLPAVCADTLIIWDGAKKIQREKVLVAIKKGSLSSGGQYQFILHEELFHK